MSRILVPKQLVLSGKDLIEFLVKYLGYHFRDRKKKGGSHITLVPPANSEHSRITVILDKELKKGTLASIIRAIGMNPEEFRIAYQEFKKQ